MSPAVEQWWREYLRQGTTLPPAIKLSDPHREEKVRIWKRWVQHQVKDPEEPR